MTLANLSGFDNITGAHQLATGANTASDGYLFPLILLGIFVVLFIVFKNYDTKAVFIGDSFICTILAIMLWGAELITFTVLVWPILILFASIMALLFWPDS